MSLISAPLEFLLEIASINPLIIFLIGAIILAVIFFVKKNIFLVISSVSLIVLGGFLFSASGQNMLDASRELPTRTNRAECFIASVKQGVPLKSFNSPKECQYNGEKLG